jgi:murein DD-endopeptidase MepM/ murein hydrolase activator NlpD
VVASGGKHGVTDDGRVNPDARFYTVSCAAWGGQPNCQHWGTDVLCVDGQPVYAPYDLIYSTTGSYPENDEAHRMGQYVIGVLPDGAEFYSGHLRDALAAQSGQRIPAGTVIGRCRADLGHTHIQLRMPGGQLADWERYAATH